MNIELTWLGHGSWSMKFGTVPVLLDPFLTENPAAPCKAADLEAKFILVSHGHFDHVADVAPIAQRTGATVVANYEIAEWFGQNHGLAERLGMNLGGSVQLPFGRVTMTLAYHSSQLPDGSYGGNPGGFLENVSSGSGTAGSRMVTLNRDQWVVVVLFSHALLNFLLRTRDAPNTKMVH